MAILYLCGEINGELATHFLDQFNKVKKTEPITIYLNTEGGVVADAQLLVDIINKNKSRITLIGCGYLYSAGFNIFFESICKRLLVEDTVGMAHFSWAPFALNEAGEPMTDEDRFLMNTMKTNKNRSIERFKAIGLNKSEMGKLKANKEAFFTYDRLNELLNGKQNT